MTTDAYPWEDTESLRDAVAALRDRAEGCGEPCDEWYADQLTAILEATDDRT